MTTLYNCNSNSTSKKDPTKQIQYDYYSNTITKTSSNGYIKSTYSGKANSPNIYFFNNNNKQSFVSKNLYVFIWVFLPQKCIYLFICEFTV